MSYEAANPPAEQNPAAETIAHLSAKTYQQRVTTLAKRIRPRLANDQGVLETVNYNRVLGQLRAIERVSRDNPFSILEHTTYTLDEYDRKQIQDQEPVEALTEQTRRHLAGDVQKRLLELESIDQSVNLGSSCQERQQ